MDNRRIFLLAAGFFVVFLIYQAWMQDYGPNQTATPAPTLAANNQAPEASAPPLPPIPEAETPTKQPASQTAAVAPKAVAPQGKLIHVHTDVLDLNIDTAGGNIRDARLLDYPEDLKDPQVKVHVLSNVPADLLLFQSGLQTRSGPIAPGQSALYASTSDEYILAQGQHTIDVSLDWKDPRGLEVEKTYHFTRGSYQIDVTYKIRNHSDQTWQGSAYAQFQNHYTPSSHSLFSVHRYDYQRAAMHGDDGYQQYEFKDLAEKPLAEKVAGGWVGVVNHYFLAAAIPQPASKTATDKNFYYSKTLGDADYLVGVVSAAQSVAPAASATFSDRLFLGPKLQTRLAGVAPGLELTVDYGKLTIIAQPIFWVLEQIHRFIGNWGWSILVLTLLLKLLTYKLNEISGRSMAKMRLVQPRLKALQERYKDDRAKSSQAMMEFYKKEKINPMGGCLPMLVQMPIFFALYYVLVYSVELRQSPWIGWIHDLSAPDPLYILPVVYGVVMFVQQRISPQPTTDNMQRKIMMVMPLGIAVLYAVLPSGLALYYVANSVLTIAQQWRINHVIERDSKQHVKK
ncbi:MAG TPA: membrane protein insertase YidC [Gammaproteobacteria bacterium]|nr:membrane protein insertase YidC [Gammaproteobacteria bacterium]